MSSEQPPTWQQKLRQSGRSGCKPKHDWPAILEHAIANDMTYIQVAKATGVSRNAVKAAAFKHGAVLRSEMQQVEAAKARWANRELAPEQNENEEWRPCPSWPGYQASSCGRVRSRHGVLKAGPSKSGYPVANPSIGGRQHPVAIHRMVAEAFHGPQPPGMECRHLDGNRMNSRPDNLAWGTRLENQRDRVAHGTTNHGAANGRVRISAEVALQIYARAKAGEKAATIAADHGIHPACVWAIKNGRTWSHVTGAEKNVDPKRTLHRALLS